MYKLLEWKIIRQDMCALIWWSESEKISKGPKLNEIVAYNPFYDLKGPVP
jgi:hypothetical protein